MEIAGVKCTYTIGQLYVEISGEVDHHTVKIIRDEIDKAIFYYRAKLLLLDLRAVSFMDSSGLGLILGRYTHQKELGGMLKIVNPTPSIEKILVLAGTGRYIPIVKTEMEAERARKE